MCSGFRPLLKLCRCSLRMDLWERDSMFLLALQLYTAERLRRLKASRPKTQIKHTKSAQGLRIYLNGLMVQYVGSKICGRGFRVKGFGTIPQPWRTEAKRIWKLGLYSILGEVTLNPKP